MRVRRLHTWLLLVGAGALAALAVSFFFFIPMPSVSSVSPSVTIALPATPAAPPAAETPPPAPPPVQAEAAPPPSAPTSSPPLPQVAALPTPNAPPAPEPFVVDRKAIARTQFYLEQLGYQIGAADGALGRRTKVAIASFRKANALPAGEHVDGPLIDALDAAVKQLPSKYVEGVPSAAPRVPVTRTPLSN